MSSIARLKATEALERGADETAEVFADGIHVTINEGSKVERA